MDSAKNIENDQSGLITFAFNGKDIGPSAKFPCPVLTSTMNITKGTHALWDNRYAYPVTHNAGWHFSYLGGAEGIKTKLESFSHSEYDTDHYKDAQRIEQAISTGGDLFGRLDHEFEYVRIDETFPKYLVDNKSKYRRHIL